MKRDISKGEEHGEIMWPDQLWSDSEALQILWWPYWIQLNSNNCQVGIRLLDKGSIGMETEQVAEPIREEHVLLVQNLETPGFAEVTAVSLPFSQWRLYCQTD